MARSWHVNFFRMVLMNVTERPFLESLECFIWVQFPYSNSNREHLKQKSEFYCRFFQNFLIDCILKKSNMESRLAPKSIQKVRLRSGFQFWIVCDFLIINWSAVNFSLSKIREYECQYIRIIFYNSFQVTIRFKTENWLRYVSSDLNL